jgi:hypothetical protein
VTSGPWLLVLDTATTTIVVGAGAPDGELLAEDAFEGRFRHSQELLPAIARLTERARRRLPDLGGIVVGTGPGAFTGLRVGLATAKTLAHELGRPLVGVSTAEALLAASSGAMSLWLPSGPRDRVLVTPGAQPRIVRADDPEGSDEGVAVDLEGRASEGALARGRDAVAGLAATLLRLGVARLARGEADDPELLVPRYASAPRGAPAEVPEGAVAWLRDPR